MNECCNNNSALNTSGCGTNFREAVCIHTDKVYDSCRDKDCLENIRVYLTSCGQQIVDKAISVKCTKAEVIWVFSDIDRSKYNIIVSGKGYKQITAIKYDGVQSCFEP